MKLLILGLDSVPPELLFERFLDKLPNIRRLYQDGVHGVLETCNPPITVPAWMVMFSGKNPGRLGIYGFKHRRGASYTDGYIVNSGTMSEPTVWDILGKKGLKTCLLGIPPSYPPKPINGNLVTDFLTPDSQKQYTYPSGLKAEIEALVGEYMFDVAFRVEDRDELKKGLFEMTEKRFKVADYLARKKDWDLFVVHEIGFDRLHHAFWKFFDPSHPKYAPGNKYESVAEEYYRFVDDRVGELIEAVGKDVAVLVMSDHGSKAMKGAFCVNQWLIQQGYLKLSSKPEGVCELEKATVDWTGTKAWGWGGYYARIFFNVKGREALGVIEPGDLERFKDEMKERLSSIRDPAGNAMNNVVYEPQELYGEAKGDKPDLMVYFGNLDWRSAGTIGHDSLYLSENDTGPDDSVHSMEGVFIFRGKEKGMGRDLGRIQAEDIAPSLLRLFNVEIPADMKGKAIELE